MGAYKRDVVVVIEMGAYIHGCLFCVGAYYPDFTVMSGCVYCTYPDDVQCFVIIIMILHENLLIREQLSSPIHSLLSKLLMCRKFIMQYKEVILIP